MAIPTNILTYAQWSGIVTLICLVLTVVAFLFQWGIRFRFVGVTSFLTVLTVSIFALGLGLSTHKAVPGAVRFSLVYDNGANQAVITVPSTITPTQLDATLRQAADDLFSYGRVGLGGNNQLTVRARTLLHPEPGLSIPLYLGEIKHSLRSREDEKMEVNIFEQNLAKLVNKSSVGSSRMRS